MPNRREIMSQAVAVAALLAMPRWASAASVAPNGALRPVLDSIANDVVAKNPETATSLGLDRGDRAALSGSSPTSPPLLTPPAAPTWRASAAS